MRLCRTRRRVDKYGLDTEAEVHSPHTCNRDNDAHFGNSNDDYDAVSDQDDKEG